MELQVFKIEVKKGSHGDILSQEKLTNLSFPVKRKKPNKRVLLRHLRHSGILPPNSQGRFAVWQYDDNILAVGRRESFKPRYLVEY